MGSAMHSLQAGRILASASSADLVVTVIKWAPPAPPAPPGLSVDSRLGDC